MIDLKEVITKYPECLESSEKLRAYLTDLYPNEKAKVSIIVAIFNCGIAEEIKNSSSVEDIVIERFCTRLENDFGYSRKLSNDCIDLWLEAYCKKRLRPKTNIQKNNIDTAVITPTPKVNQSTSKPNIHNTSNIQNSKSIKNNTPKPTIDKNTKFQKDGITYVCNLDDFQINSTGGLEKYKGKEQYVILPQSVRCIEKYAFNRNDILKRIILPDSVSVIGQYAFANCVNLSNIEIPNSVTQIHENAFYNCTSLINVTIPNSVTVVGISAFSLCKNLVSCNIGNGLTNIAKGMFEDCYKLENVSLGKNVVSLGNKAFRNCNSLKTITIPQGITHIGDETFYMCSNLTNISMPKSIRGIGDNAFLGCALTKIDFLDGITKIGAGAFSNCRNLKNVVIPSSVTSIGDGAFAYCHQLTSAQITNSVTNMGKDIFLDCHYSFKANKINGIYNSNSSNTSSAHKIVKNSNKKSAKRNGEKRKIAWLHTGTLALLIISLFCFSYMFFVEKFLLEVLFALLAAGGFYLVILLFELSRRE